MYHKPYSMCYGFSVWKYMFCTSLIIFESECFLVLILIYWEIIWIVFSENNEMFGVTSHGINSFGSWLGAESVLIKLCIRVSPCESTFDPLLCFGVIRTLICIITGISCHYVSDSSYKNFNKQKDQEGLIFSSIELIITILILNTLFSSDMV